MPPRPSKCQWLWLMGEVWPAETAAVCGGVWSWCWGTGEPCEGIEQGRGIRAQLTLEMGLEAGRAARGDPARIRGTVIALDQVEGKVGSRL